MNRLLRENWMTILVIALILVGYLFLRTPGDDLSSTAEFQARLTGEGPLVVEFYSNT